MKNHFIFAVMISISIAVECESKSIQTLTPTQTFIRYQTYQENGQYDHAYAMIEEQSKLRMRETIIEFLSAVIPDPEFRPIIQTKSTRQIFEAIWRSTTYHRTDVISENIKGDRATLVIRSHGINPPLDMYRYLIKIGDNWLMYHPSDAKGLVNPADAERAINQGFTW